MLSNGNVDSLGIFRMCFLYLYSCSVTRNNLCYKSNLEFFEETD
ncbi:hypothetical protein SAMN06266787_10856 [Halorubrum ezzemoulense]|uniref:Uncharacterized protein n=1 Tax=Halorubrum ezzemoulense TaxID=337243 RepID=A0A238Y4I5_HALEZ|nr:hypothetical protein SAMN06266787_10856 [Halorubrum ezzemoulense]